MLICSLIEGSSIRNLNLRWRNNITSYQEDKDKDSLEHLWYYPAWQKVYIFWEDLKGTETTGLNKS